MLPHSDTYFIPIPSQPVFALSPYCCVLSREATNTNFIVIGLTRCGYISIEVLDIVDLNNRK